MLVLRNVSKYIILKILYFIEFDKKLNVVLKK